MAFKYDINQIFADLRKQINKERSKTNESKENNPIESPEDVPETQEVEPATSKTTEDTHGGDEASREIKDSPNSIENGENSEKENKSEITENTGEKGEGIGNGKNKTDKRTDKDYNIIKHGKTTTNEQQVWIEKLFEEKEKKQKEFRKNNRQEYIKRYILEIIKKIAADHSGIDKQDGSEAYDKREIMLHMMKKQSHKILGDKYDLRDARYVQFFIDTSGVYGCGSNKVIHELMPQVISILEKQGYECYIAACANGFYSKDMVEDEYFETRKTLEEYNAGKVSKISCPTPETAAKMANEAEFSIILADFDGLSSICYMTSLCEKDKVPYLLCTEDRYPWEDPALHDWVDPDYCDYNPNLVYDVSMYGNPTLDQYYDRQFDDYDYDAEDDYDYNN